MVLETIVYPIFVSILGGIGSAVYGAYRATSGGEEFDKKKFITLIPKSIVGGVAALGLGLIVPSVTDVTTLEGFVAMFGIGFIANEVIKGRKAKPEPEVPA